MNKNCPNCGASLPSGVKFCTSCGAKIEETQESSVKLIAKRDLVVAILLSLVTCGIYGIYWFIVMTDDANVVSSKQDTSGAMCFLLSLVTCGIYSFFWNYQMGKKMYEAGKMHNIQIDDNSVLYLILSLFGLGIVSYALIQNDLNKFA